MGDYGQKFILRINGFFLALYAPEDYRGTQILESLTGN